MNITCFDKNVIQLNFFVFVNITRIRLHLLKEISVDLSMNDDGEDDEVWLHWIDQNKEPHGKPIRSISMDAKSNHKEAIDFMTYYRSDFFFHLSVTPFY